MASAVRGLRPFDQGALAEVGEPVKSALDAHEPPIDVPEENFGCVRDRALQVARPAWSSGQRNRACERLLPVGREYRPPRGAPDCRIAAAALVLGHDLGPALRIAAWTPGTRLDQDLDFAACRYAHEPEAQQPAELAHPRVTFPATAANGGADRKPNLVADRR